MAVNYKDFIFRRISNRYFSNPMAVMHSFEDFLTEFEKKFAISHFPNEPASLYGAAQYFLGIGGKRVRPVMCLMGNELFDEVNPDAWHAAVAIELFHNFTLIHDDIMDKAPLRRGKPTVHEKYSEATALLSGDVMMVVAYDWLNKIKAPFLHKIIQLFNKTAREVCEGQQLDMDFEKRDSVTMDEYIQMIELKTSVLLAASLKMGALLGGAGEGNQQHLYGYGKSLGIAFQVQDDYLDAFGDPQKFGKQVGGDIIANKKTFLMIHALEVASASEKKELMSLTNSNATDKVTRVLSIFRSCGVDEWALQLKNQYLNNALQHLDNIAVLSSRKEPLAKIAGMLVKREY